MKTTYQVFKVLMVMLWLTTSGVAVQATEEPSPPPPVVETNIDAGEVVRIGGSYTVLVNQRVESVVVLSGSARIEGEVEQDVVVVVGGVKLASSARVGGDVVVVAGAAEVEAGAAVDGDLVVVGGGLDIPAGFTPGGDQVAIGTVPATGQLATTAPWLTRGLLWGRPIVPNLPWVWVMVAVFALLCLLINLVFEGPVRICTQALNEKPLSTGLAGFLVLLLIAPVSLILVLSVVGLAVVPFLWFAFLIAALIGNVAVARWIGSRILAEESPQSRLEATRSLVIGLALISLVYMVPVLGITAWALVGLLGLGAASTALLAGLRRENPVPSVSTNPPPTAASGSAAPVDNASATSTAETAPPDSLATATDLSAFPRATFLRRLGALLLDFFLVILITKAIFDLDMGKSFVLLLAYRVALWGWKGTTVGGIICQLRVARMDGAPIRFTDSLVRGLSSIFSAVVIGLGWLWILWDSERQAWHDKIAGTIVVRVPASWPV